MVNNPEAGTWTAELQDGSSALASSFSAHGLPEPQVQGSVSDTGASRTLTWTLEKIPGQTVRFVENGDASTKVITITSEASGSVKFTPAPGPAGTR